MKAGEIIELGTQLGLPFNIKSNFPDSIKKDLVVFDGANAQRFLIDGTWDDAEIYKNLGQALKSMGEMEHRMQLHRLLQIF